MNLLLLHMLLVFMWGCSFLALIKSVQLKEYSKILAVLSIVFMLSVLFVGTKLMLMFPNVAKSGMWIHIKLSIDILAMLVNIYVAYLAFKKKEKKLLNILFWITLIMFAAMYYLTLYKPF
jgi:putative membrane protein